MHAAAFSRSFSHTQLRSQFTADPPGVYPTVSQVAAYRGYLVSQLPGHFCVRRYVHCIVHGKLRELQYGNAEVLGLDLREFANGRLAGGKLPYQLN